MNGRTWSVVVFAGLSSLALQGVAYAKVAPITLSELVKQSDTIILAKVECVRRPFFGIFGTKYARARVLEVWKGTVGESADFRAAPSWTCDTSNAIEGETVVLFLSRDKGGSRLSISHSGRGRMPVRTVAGKHYATIWISDVRLSAGTETTDGPEPKCESIRSLLVDSLKRLVQNEISEH